MMDRTWQPPAQLSASDALPPAGLGADPNRAIRSASLTAGVGVLLMSALAGFGYFAAVEGLVTPGDAARTASDISASEGLFRLGVISLFLVVALDVVVACGLYRVFSPVSQGLSLLAAWLRIVYGGVFMVAIGQLVGVPRLLGNDAATSRRSARISCRPRRSCESIRSTTSGTPASSSLAFTCSSSGTWRTDRVMSPSSWASCSALRASAIRSTASSRCSPRTLRSRLPRSRSSASSC